MIRVLQVVTHMNRGGLETMLMNYYREMDKDQIQFDFLTHRPYDGDYGNEIKSLGGKIFHLPTLNPFSNSYKRALTDFFNQHPEYKAIHVHQDCMSSVILKIAKKCGVQVRIAHSHSKSQDKNIKYIIKKHYKKKIPQYATSLLACGTEAGDWMFGGESYSIINNAINSEKYVFDKEIAKKVREELGVESSTFLVGHVGRFSPPKNHIFIIKVFNEIKKLLPNSKLLLVGDDKGSIADRAKELVREYRIEDTVIFAGVRTDVNELLQAMDVFVFPSLYEGLPVTLVEAQASGLPCVISDNVPSECIITDLIHYLPLTSEKQWAEKVIEVYKSSERKDTSSLIKDAGFDIKKNAMNLKKFYEEKYESIV